MPVLPLLAARKASDLRLFSPATFSNSALADSSIFFCMFSSEVRICSAGMVGFFLA